MKKHTVSFVAGLLTGIMLFGGGVAYAAGVMAEYAPQRAYVDGVPVQMNAYNIGGNNYVKLRDIGQMVGFNVYWDGQAVQISSDTPYTGEAPAQDSAFIRVEPTIITAIHNVKSNHGSETPGVDSRTMRKDYLQKPFLWVVKDIQKAFKHFEPQKIRRVYIDKPGKAEKRPLGIPTMRDRIVQECMRIVLEPILEAQFFAHSYGFRPMRDTSMALERINFLTHSTGYAHPG